MKLSIRWVRRLQALPESGMGYQIVDVRLKSGTILREIPVFNCEEVPSLSLSEEDIADITSHA